MLLHEEEMIDKAWREELRSKMTAKQRILYFFL